jgi:hypothetical protein
MRGARSIGSRWLLALCAGGCGGPAAKSDAAVGGPDLAATIGGGDGGGGGDAGFRAHALQLGLPAMPTVVTKYLRAGDWIYGLDQQAAAAVALRNGAAGTRAGVLLAAGCCASSETKGYPAGVDAVIYDYRPNTEGCTTDRCSGLPMYCGGVAAGLPTDCTHEPSYRCDLAQHQSDLLAVRNAAAVQGIGAWAMPTLFSPVVSSGCPAPGAPIDIDWGALAASADGLVFQLQVQQADAATALSQMQKALDSVHAASPSTPVWAELSLAYTVLCGKLATCTVGPPAGCDPVAEAAKLAPLVTSLGALRTTAGGTTGQLDGVLLAAESCDGPGLDMLLGMIR